MSGLMLIADYGPAAKQNKKVDLLPVFSCHEPSRDEVMVVCGG